MSWNYFCPHCSAGLNPDETIILIGECGGRRTLVGFHREPGDYRSYVPPEVVVVPGSRWDFACPVCQQSLASKIEGGLCAIDGLREGMRHRVYFSPVAGEQATFLVSAEGIRQHGKDAEKHSLDLLGDL